MNIISQTDLSQYSSRVLEYRRHLHAHPELSFQEFKTSQFVVDEMEKLEHVEIIRPAGTSVLVKFVTGKPGPKIGLRADMDALAIQEDRQDLAFHSKNEGVMHACGHDGHTAMLMTACHYFNDHFDELEGEIWAIFQHAEELLPGGAQEMVATGLFNELDFIYGQHLWSSLPTGTLDIKDGPASSNTDIYDIKIQGKGGHSSQPENSIDPIVIGSQIVQKFQTIVSRQIAPHEAGVISNTVFQSGSPDALNVIPDTCYLGGSVRSSSEAMRQLFYDSITKMTHSTCEDYGATCEINYVFGYGVTDNNPEKTAFVRTLGEQFENTTVIADKCMLGGEDFSAFSHIVPSTFVFIGSRNEAEGFDYPHHHPKFGVDETALMHGVQLLVNVVRNYGAYFNEIS
ncbi:amidohydrolase [Ignatzschineria sp. RMDPL8A]|uniref:amidohydrolase n=1 Tax=Ignatzschineria sp. RMDPL8A TaxID=2999236 RepID=UPI0024466636|nr:amidohydrolase [Ignatzschineria sp. RMDPL8A]MDG9729309.1 amidohydrolase [Ignatzschineria sp. RMDPL8A]